MKKERVAVVRCESYVSNVVGKALRDSLNLIDFKFKKGTKVLIKPNILGAHTPEQCVTTNPIIVEELCKVLKANGCKIYIGESSASETDRAFEVCGIAQVARKYGQLINFEKERKIKVKINNPSSKFVYLPKILGEVDLIVNMPKLKTHVLTRMTGSVKNLFGCVPGKAKMGYHKIFASGREMSGFFLDLYQAIKPGLNILDGIVGLEGYGPGASGEPKKTGLILTSRNGILLDVVAGEIIGFKENEVFTNAAARSRGLIGKPEMVGNGFNKKVIYKKPISFEQGMGIYQFLLRLLPADKISFHYDRCIKCGKCKNNCPVSAIQMKPYPICNPNGCIQCFCCMEVCPKRAVYLNESWLRKGLKTLRYIKK